MPRHIDADKARSIENLDNYGAFALGIGTISDVQAVLDDAPTADVSSVVHAEWKEYDGTDRGYHYCMNCEQQAFNYGENENVIEVLSNYCPKCGAKMDGGNENV